MSRDWMANDDEDDVLDEPVMAQPAVVWSEDAPPSLVVVGRPKGSTTSDRQQIALRIPRRVLDHFKAGGPGWQTRMIAVLEREVDRG